MSRKPDFDEITVHRFYSVECFNQAWELMDKPERTPEENETMLRLSLASHWHWTQRPDCTKINQSIGFWQTSRIYAMLMQADNARHYGQLCLKYSQGEDVPPFYLGYAYEALARAESVAGNLMQKEDYIRAARGAADKIKDAEAKKMLLADLYNIQ